MSRRERLCSIKEARRILSEGNHGVLCMAADSEPYGVPLNYCYVPEENALFFHCAQQGTKLEMLRKNPRVAFVIAGNVRIDSKRLTTYYESAMVFGTASMVTEPQEKEKRLCQLCAFLTPGYPKNGFGKCAERTAVVRFDIERISGKINAAPSS